MSKYMNPIKSASINFDNEPLLTIHCDGRVTTSDRLKPTETAVLVLNQIKTQWMKDAQATKIRELQDRIKRLEEAAMMALHGCYNGPMPDHVRDALADAMEAKP